MSKYFDETARMMESRQLGGAPVLVSGGSAAPPAEEPVVEEIAPAKKTEPRIQDAPKLEVPIGSLIADQFLGSDALESAQESYRALRTRLLRQRATNGLRSIVITSASQGEGKTLTSANLGLCCAQLQDMKVLLIDGDIRTHGLTRMLGLQGKAGLCTVLEDKCDFHEALLGTDCDNLFILSSGSSTLPPAELLASPKWESVMNWSRENFDLVIVDCPPVLNLADVELTSSFCDGILMVVRALRTAREQLKRCTLQLDQKKILGVVFNGAEGSHHSYKYAYKAPKGS